MYAWRSLWTTVIACWLMAAQAPAAERITFQQLLDQRSPAVVTVKYVMQAKARGGGRDQEGEAEAAGVMIDPGGLVLCANSQLSAVGGALGRLLSMNMPQASRGIDIKDVRVVVGPEEDELEAKILARDADLDLAWVQIDKPEGTYPAIDLSQAAEPALGDTLLGVRRLGKFFDRAGVVHTGLVCGETRRPRRLWLTQETLSDSVGLPMFTGDGGLVGIVVTQKPVLEGEPDASQMMSLMNSLFTSASGDNGIILPAADVAKATARAKAGEIKNPEPASKEAGDQPDGDEKDDTKDESEDGQ